MPGIRDHLASALQLLIEDLARQLGVGLRLADIRMKVDLSTYAPLDA
jgi:hypothetical protein